jgi:hypothetical protein
VNTVRRYEPEPSPGLPPTVMANGTIRREVQELASKLLDHLIDAEGEFRKMNDLARAMDCTRGQVDHAWVYLREEVAQLKGVAAIAKTGRHGGIAITVNSDSVTAYSELRSRSIRTQLNRLLSGSVRPMIHAVTTKAEKRYWSGLQDDFEYLVKKIDTALVTDLA